MTERTLNREQTVSERAVEISGGLTVDFEHQTCLTPDGKVVRLTRGEIITLTSLSEKYPRDVNALAFRQELYRGDFEPNCGDKFVSKELVRTYVYRLRKKLGKELIISKPRTGYLIRK